MRKNELWVQREELIATAISRITEVDVVLDIGCGIMPHDYITPALYICAEPCEEYVNVLKNKVSNNNKESLFIVLHSDWEQVVKDFCEQSVDTVFLIDVIEHLDKQTGERLLKLTERIVRRQIVVFTPLGFVEQKIVQGGKDAWGLHGAEWQAHKSGWLPEDFDESWDIIACKDFHLRNNLDELVDEPFGAFWAIKNIQLTENPSEIFRHTINFIKQENTKLLQDLLKLQQENTKLCNRYKYLERILSSRMGQLFFGNK